MEQQLSSKEEISSLFKVTRKIFLAHVVLTIVCLSYFFVTAYIFSEIENQESVSQSIAFIALMMLSFIWIGTGVALSVATAWLFLNGHMEGDNLSKFFCIMMLLMPVIGSAVAFRYSTQLYHLFYFEVLREQRTEDNGIT